MEEQQKLTSPDAPRERGKTWIVFSAFIAILAAMVVFAIVFRGASGKLNSPDNVERPEVMLSDEPIDPENITPEPTVMPTQTAATPAPTQQEYLKTAVIVNGRRYVVMSSLQAAEELMMNVISLVLHLTIEECLGTEVRQRNLFPSDNRFCTLSPVSYQFLRPGIHWAGDQIKHQVSIVLQRSHPL